MSETKWTPGPWVIGGGGESVRSADWHPICNMLPYWDHPEWASANARLCAAAPELAAQYNAALIEEAAARYLRDPTRIAPLLTGAVFASWPDGRSLGDWLALARERDAILTKRGQRGEVGLFRYDRDEHIAVRGGAPAMKRDPFFNRRQRSMRAAALDRPELRQPTAPRVAPAGVTSMPVKIVDPEIKAMVEAALRARREGRP